MLLLVWPVLSGFANAESDLFCIPDFAVDTKSVTQQYVDFSLQLMDLDEVRVNYILSEGDTFVYSVIQQLVCPPCLLFLFRMKAGGQ